MATEVHTTHIENRQATCCGSHRWEYLVCSCGHEVYVDRRDNIGSAIRAHQVQVIVKALGLKFKHDGEVRYIHESTGT